MGLGVSPWAMAWGCLLGGTPWLGGVSLGQGQGTQGVPLDLPFQARTCLLWHLRRPLANFATETHRRPFNRFGSRYTVPREKRKNRAVAPQRRRDDGQSLSAESRSAWLRHSLSHGRPGCVHLWSLSSRLAWLRRQSLSHGEPGCVQPRSLSSRLAWLRLRSLSHGEPGCVRPRSLSPRLAWLRPRSLSHGRHGCVLPPPRARGDP